MIKQPFPKAVKIKAKANNHSEDPVHVQLIKAPKADCRCVGPVRAHILPEEYQPKRSYVFFYQLDEIILISHPN